MKAVNGLMTNAVVKPQKNDGDGYMKDPGFLAITFKVDLHEFTEEELGDLLLRSALGDEMSVTIVPRQLEMKVPKEPEAEGSSQTEIVELSDTVAVVEEVEA